MEEFVPVLLGFGFLFALLILYFVVCLVCVTWPYRLAIMAMDIDGSDDVVDDSGFTQNKVRLTSTPSIHALQANEQANRRSLHFFKE